MNLKNIEKKWQKKWEENSSHKVSLKEVKNKKYCLTMFSYPSGDKLHIGHWYNYGPVDTYARFLKMNGYNVFQPQGFDAFGLPAENYAIKHGIHPSESTEANIKKMKSQLTRIGAMFNWEEEINTSTPDYYKWTQWIFLQLYKNNLAYRKEAMVNWDPVDQTVLANEQVLSDGTSDRSGAVVIQKPLKQWFFNITKYAEELLNFDTLEWPNKTISMQRNWIGKSKGAKISFKTYENEMKLEVFTTRPDTLYGATYMVVSPEHPDLNNIVTANEKKTVKEYCKKASMKSELQRMDLDKIKTGVFTGSYAINPITDKKIPIWIADYVLMNYGTGVIMAVPGHDQRDFEFAKKYDLNILKVVDNGKNIDITMEAFCEEGFAINSKMIEGLKTKEAKNKIISWINEKKIGSEFTNYRLKDWLISRQRYWGAPIPIVYDPQGEAHPIPEEHLPWLLPDDVEYKPKGTSPLGSSKELANRTEKIFGKGWTPEIDTMDTFVCSSWYYLRYVDNNNSSKAFSDKGLKWLPVDHYIGGAEHATMHLLYARFMTKCLRDLGFLNFNEPFTHLFHQGIITKDGSKMSKSKGNTVSPDTFIDQYGSDTFRCYLMFMGPFDEGGDWNDKGITGIYRFLNRSFKLCQNIKEDIVCSSEDEYMINHTTKSVTEDLKIMKFNTALSKLMEFVNHFFTKGINASTASIFIQLLSPFAPHLSEEIWESFNNNNSIFNQPWPSYDQDKLSKSMVNLPVQVNGKLRGSIDIDITLDKENILILAKNHNNVKIYLEGKSIIKEIYVPKKIINFVIK